MGSFGSFRTVYVAWLVACFVILAHMPRKAKSFVPTSTRQATKTTARTHEKALSSHPKLIVFDLDNTLWTPELYQLRTLQRARKTPVAGKDVELMPGAQAVLQQIRQGAFPNTKFALASRTQSGPWAQDLLDQFRIRELFDFVEIFPGNKKAHFANLADASKISFQDMLFFDDARDGKYGNCEPVAELGVLSVHCPNGIYEERIFTSAINAFRDWDKTPNTIVEWDGSISVGGVQNIDERINGRVKMVNEDKGFGFLATSQKDIFFHFNNLPSSISSVRKGDSFSFVVEKDTRRGKDFASDMQPLAQDSSRDSTSTSGTMNGVNMIELPTFSMNLPFAALLANGYKTLETRNGTMFASYPEGTYMLLHVGQRIYPDGDKHIEVLQSCGGLSLKEIEQLKSLPSGFRKGQVVAICELGPTVDTTLEERCDPDFQRRVGAYGADAGRRATEIKRVAYLKKPVSMRGQGGVFPVQIDASLLPDGWQVFGSSGTGGNGSVPESSSSTSSKVVYSISG